jgi:glycosyltransferase involved in cell wall biosynthesis
MKILVLIWEFPPRLVGGIARHGAELYPELVKLGHEIHLITVESSQAPPKEIIEGIYVHRVPVDGFSQDIFNWIGNMNHSMSKYSAHLLSNSASGEGTKNFDLIHAHDWMVADTAIALSENFHIPIVATIHATEFGRNNGIHNPSSEYIHTQEKRLVEAAKQTIVCSEYMRQEVGQILYCPWERISIIYNGIRPEKKQRPKDFDFWEFRRRFAADHEQIVYYVGRMTYEKGIFVLLNAAPKVLWELGGNAKLIFIGGGNTDRLKQQAWDLNIWDKCYFTGFMSDRDLDRFQTVADCAVFPSLYEPFGIVALESFAARVPVVVSDAGGLAEVVRHTKTGIVTWKWDYNSLAWGILEVLKNPGYAKWLTDNAYDELATRFKWSKIAIQTQTVYNTTLKKVAILTSGVKI